MGTLHGRLTLVFALLAAGLVGALYALVGPAPRVVPIADARPVTWMDLMPDAEVAAWEAEQAAGPMSQDEWLAHTAALELDGSGGDLLVGDAGWTPAPQLDPDAQPRPDLDGVRVALSGYMTPLDFVARETRAFLLVPYVGACIHVPAPPPNQIVLVEAAEAVPVLDLWEPFTAIGTLRVERLDTGLAESAYVMTLDRMVALDMTGGPSADAWTDG